MNKPQRQWGATPWTREEITHPHGTKHAAEVVIIGAGLTGASTAYHLARRGISATVFEARSGKVTATIPLGGRPEFAMADPRAGRIYNNLEDTQEVAVIDSKAHAVAARWPIAPGEGASAWPSTLRTTGSSWAATTSGC